METQVLHWRDFDAHVPVRFRNAFLECAIYNRLLNNAKNFSLTFSKNGRLIH